jgi:hypothetical protein
MFTKVWHSLRSLGVVSACVFVTSVSAADPVRNDVEAAKAAFEEGRALLETGDWQGGCKKFDESLALQVNVSTLIKVARCRVHEGKLATAGREYERARALNQERRDRDSARQAELAAAIEREIGEVAPRIPRLRILVADAPAGLTILSNGLPVPPEAIGQALPVDPGAYQISVQAPGFVGETKSATIGVRTAPDQVAEVSFRLTPVNAAIDAPQPEDRSTTPTPEARPVADSTAPNTSGHLGAAPLAKHPERGRGASTRSVGYVVGGVGVAGLGAAAVLGVLTLQRVNESEDYCGLPGDTCNQHGMDLLSEARRLQNASLVVAGVSAAVLITGVTLVLSARNSPATTTVSLGPTTIAGGLQW